MSFLEALPTALLILLPLLGLGQSTTLVISQVYTAGGNSGASYTNDYVELFNKSAGPISLNGYSLAYNGGTPFALTATASIPAGGYYLVQLAAGATGAGMALPTPNQTSSVNLATAGGRLELLAPGSTLADKVAYGTGSGYEGSGAAPAPSATQAIFRPLGGCADTDDNKNDFSPAAAAPRNSTLVPSPCVGPAPTVSSFSPASGPAGTRVTVQGSGFAGNASVAFGGVGAPVVAVASATTLTATVPSGAASGPITVTTANGSATSADNFTVIVPVITVAPAVLTGLAASQGSASAPQPYQLSGSALDGTSLTITASATSLEVSLDGTNYARSASLPLNGATTLGATTVYVRLASGAALGNVNGSIANANGPTTATVAVRAAVLAPLVAKRWTGTAGTNSWFDAGNWAGGTLPGATDDVVLDHSTVAGKYTVVLGNSASTAPTAVSVASLRLRPSGGDSILFIIPSTNTVSDATTAGSQALLLTRSAAGDTALLVSNRAFFTNTSGAASGSVLDAMGSTNPTVFLLNGGSFRHQTARGVTDIVENLASAPGTEAGNFYYRPLGTSSFTTPLAGRTYGNLILQFLRNGNFTSINYGASGGSPLTVNGALTIESGATLSYNALANFILRGNLVNNGIFRYSPNYGNPAPSPLPTYRLVLQGAAPQVLKGNALIDPTASTAAQSSYLAATIQLEINNPAGVTLQTPVTLSNALALTNGLLTTDATNILTMTLAGTAAVQGGSDASFVNGPVRRPVGPVASTATAVAYVFPIGKGTAYRPLTLTVASQTGTTNYRAEQFEGNPIRNLAATDPNGFLTRVSRVRYFTLTPFNLDAAPVITQPAGFAGAVALTYGSDDGVTDATDPTLVVAKRSDVTQPWYNFGRGKASGSASGNLVMSGTITSFSDFALGSTDPATAANPLPVQLVHFAATRLAGGAVALTWTTASELRSAHFAVERSLDGATFTPVATLGAQGTSPQAHTYTTRDAGAPASALYYRLRLVDLDGTSAHSHTLTVAAGSASELVLSPNPAHDQIYFFTEAAGTYTMRTLLGQEVRRGPVASGLNQLPVGQLPAGVYLLELPAGAGRVVRRFAKE